MKTYYYIGDMGHIHSTEAEGYELSYRLRKLMGNYFKTYEEAERYTDYLLAKEVIKEDAKGFKPDWNNEEKWKYTGAWNFTHNKVSLRSCLSLKYNSIYFEYEEDIEESFEKHPKEWKTYLTYDQ